MRRLVSERSRHLWIPFVLAIGGLSVLGCVLLDRPEAVYREGSATIEEIRFLDGSPPPDFVFPTQGLSLTAGSWNPDSGQEHSRGAGAQFESSDGWAVVLQEVDNDPPQGVVTILGPGDDHRWSVSGEIRGGCAGDLGTGELSEGVVGTVTCHSERSTTGRVAFTVNFSATP